MNEISTTVTTRAPAQVDPMTQQAVDFYNRGVALAGSPSDQDKNMAYQMFVSAVTCAPGLAPAWAAIGIANSDMKLGHASIAAHRRAIEVDPRDARSMVNLGHQLYHLGRLDEAMEWTKRALALNENDAYALTNMSCILSTQGRLGKSLECAERAYAINPEPVVEFTLAFALLHMKRWSRGLAHLEARFGYRLKQFLVYPYPRWTGESLGGRTLFLVADQGIGDTMSFMRFIPALMERAEREDGRVVWQLQGDLLRLATLLFGHYKRLALVPMPQPFPPADFYTVTTSLATALALDDEQIAGAQSPEIPSLPAPAGAPWKVLGRRLHVGVCWAGSKDNDIDHWRSFGVTELLDLYATPGIQLYSLQMGPRKDELHALGTAALIRDLSPYIRDVVDTMAIIRNLDLVIGCESSVNHMCGLLGVDSWIAYSYHGRDWRIGLGDGPPLWYPRTRVFRQGADAMWLPVFRRMNAALKERMS